MKYLKRFEEYEVGDYEVGDYVKVKLHIDLSVAFFKNKNGFFKNGIIRNKRRHLYKIDIINNKDKIERIWFDENDIIRKLNQNEIEEYNREIDSKIKFNL